MNCVSVLITSFFPLKSITIHGSSDKLKQHLIWNILGGVRGMHDDVIPDVLFLFPCFITKTVQIQFSRLSEALTQDYHPFMPWRKKQYQRSILPCIHLGTTGICYLNAFQLGCICVRQRAKYVPVSAPGFIAFRASETSKSFGPSSLSKDCWFREEEKGSWWSHSSRMNILLPAPLIQQLWKNGHEPRTSEATLLIL